MTIGTVAKAISAAVVAGLTAAITALDDGYLTLWEWTVIVGAFLVAAGAVWKVPNIPEGVRVYGKAVTAGLVAAVAAVGAALVADLSISPDEWLAIIVALISGLGLTWAVPNAEYSDGYRAATASGIDTPAP